MINTWTSGSNTAITTSAGVSNGSITNSLEFNTAAAVTLTLTGTSTLQSGGIMETSAVGNYLVTITGGYLATGGTDVIVNQYNPSNGMTIASNIIGGLTIMNQGGGTLTVSGGVNEGVYPVSLMGSGSATINGAITGSGGVIVTGSGFPTVNAGGATYGTGGTGVLTLGGANTYTGTTTINGGILKISAANGLGNSTGIIFGGVGTGNVNWSASGTPYTSPNPMSMLESTAGTYALPANQNITLNGAATIQDDSGTLTINGNINTNGNLLNFNSNGGAFVVNGSIGGSGGVEMEATVNNGAGAGLVFNAANTYGGPTILDGEYNGSNGSDQLKISAASNLATVRPPIRSSLPSSIPKMGPWIRPMERIDLGVNRSILITGRNGTTSVASGGTPGISPDAGHAYRQRQHYHERERVKHPGSREYGDQRRHERGRRAG